MNRAAPLAINNSPAHRTVRVKWADQEIQTISHEQLRGACPCAKCRAARIQGRISLVDAEVSLTIMNHMGYGLQMVFSDGHDRGIYPWSYLFELQ